MQINDKIHYNLDKLDKEGALFNLILGKRANGKSFQVKHKKAITKYLDGETRYYTSYLDKDNIFKKSLEKGSRFVLLRRFKDEVNTANVEQYFNDVDVMKLTNNECNCITAFRGKIYLSFYNAESNKTVKKIHVGYYRALSQEQNSASTSMLDVTDIIFEEFISRSEYLGINEPTKLMNFYSTVDRGRGIVRLWLVGNSITKVCPYFYAWGLSDLIRGMNKGDIRTNWISTGDYDENGIEIMVKLAVEYCENSGGTNFIIGNHKEMLNAGDWQADPQPHLPKSYKKYKILYRIMFQYQTFKFVSEYLLDKNGDTCWFVYPYNGKIKDKTICFSDIIKTSPYYQRDIYNPSFKNQKLKDLLKTFKENKIFYATDLCGTDFKQVIDFEIKK